MTLALLIAAGIVTGLIIGKARKASNARKAYAAQIAAQNAARIEREQALARRDAWDAEAAKMEKICVNLKIIRERARTENAVTNANAAAMRLQKLINAENARARIAQENARYLDRVLPAWNEHTEILANYAGAGTEEDKGRTVARIAALNAEKARHETIIKALKAG